MKKNKKKPISWQAPTAIVFLLIGIAGFLWAFLPPKQNTITLDLQEIRVPLPDSNYAFLQQPYQMQITAPSQAKAGSSFGYTFKLQKSEQSINITVQDVNIYELYQLNISLTPDFANTTINPPGSMTTALIEDQEPAMSWKMTPTGKETIEGIFWVHIDFIPLQEGVENSSTALLARTVEIPIQTIIGLNTRWVAILSTALTVVAVFLGIPQLPFFKGEPDDKHKK